MLEAACDSFQRFSHFKRQTLATGNAMLTSIDGFVDSGQCSRNGWFGDARLCQIGDGECSGA